MNLPSVNVTATLTTTATVTIANPALSFAEARQKLLDKGNTIVEELPETRQFVLLRVTEPLYKIVST